MTPRATIRPEAARDLDEQFEYLADRSAEQATRFLTAVRSSLQRLLDQPELGVTRGFNHEALRNVRVWMVRGFPRHLIYYRSDPEGIEVIRLLHGDRDIVALFGDDPDH
jgi:toxin ParE1/3/4